MPLKEEREKKGEVGREDSGPKRLSQKSEILPVNPHKKRCGLMVGNACVEIIAASRGGAGSR